MRARSSSLLSIRGESPPAPARRRAARPPARARPARASPCRTAPSAARRRRTAARARRRRAARRAGRTRRLAPSSPSVALATQRVVAPGVELDGSAQLRVVDRPLGQLPAEDGRPVPAGPSSASSAPKAALPACRLGELARRDVDDARPCRQRQHLTRPQQVLVERERRHGVTSTRPGSPARLARKASSARSSGKLGPTRLWSSSLPARTSSSRCGRATAGCSEP